MSKQKWEVKSHNYQIADTGDYDGYWEVTNGNISLMTKDDPDEDDVLKDVADALNKSECEFYTDDSDKYLAHHYKQEMEKGDREIEKLRAENEKMRKAAKIELLWELIEEWQDAQDVGEDISAPKFSFNDIEIDFYEKMEQIDPNGKKLKGSKAIKTNTHDH